MTRFVTIVVPLLLSLGTAQAACTDAAAVAATRAAAEAQCPCAAASGHKAYIRCVAQVAKTAAQSGSLPKQCRASVVGCARKSTCGKAGFVTCFRTTAKGSQRCAVKPSAAKCMAPKGGAAFVGTLPSCCDSCTARSCAEATTTTTAPGATTTTTLARPHTSVVSGTNGNADNRFCSPSDMGCDNPPLSNMGATYEHTFVQAGTFPYYCSVHFLLGMTGTITVQ